QEHSAHRRIHRNGARPIQGFLEALTMAGQDRSIAPHGRSSRAISWRSLARWRSHLARSALPRADCRVGLQHHSVLGFGTIEQRAALDLYGYRFYRPLDHFCRRSSLRFQRCLQVLDHGLKLLVRQALDHIAVLDLVLARAQPRQDLQIRGRLCSAHTFNRLRTAMPKVSQQCRNKLAVQLLTVTRADRTAGRVSRPPSFEWHGGLSLMSVPSLLSVCAPIR